MQINVPSGGLATGREAPHSAEVLGRFSASARHRVPWIVVLAVAVVAAQAAAVVPLVTGSGAPVPAYRIVFRLIGGAFTVCGLIAWRRRPDSRSGLLMVATGFGLLVEPVFDPIDPSPLRTIGDLTEDAWGIPIIALLLTFLTGGRLVSRLDRTLVGIFVVATALEVARHFFLVREGNFLLVHPDAGVARALVSTSTFLVSIGCLAVAGVIAARWLAASRPRRRAMLPSVAGISALLLFAVVQHASPLALQWLAVVSLLTIPAAFLAGLLRSRLARGGLAELLRELPAMHGAALQERLARTLGDPGLVLAYRVPGRQAYAGADGEPVRLPPAGGELSVAPIERGGREVAALVYDAALDDDPDLVEAVAAATSVALDNQHLHAESQSRLDELRASRRRLVAAGDSERRRLERDLHDGAQQRLVALSMQLRLIQADIRRDPAAAEQLVQGASSELALSLAELRELARGIHPAALEHGLPSALESLAARATVPTGVACDAPERMPRPVELAVYFVACEALANVGKYACATAASIELSRTAVGVAIQIADDGVGGADAAAGSGLRGLADRVEALDGHLLVTSPHGAGTVVVAELPCGS
jgi:signal transduction histidine kinase